MAGVTATRSASTAWRRDFRKLWAVETVSGFGNNMTAVALPLTAAATMIFLSQGSNRSGRCSAERWGGRGHPLGALGRYGA